MSRLILFIIVIPIVLIILAALLVPMFLDKEKVLEMATEALHEQTGATLTVTGDVNLSLFPTIGISLEGAELTMPDEEQPSMKVRALDIGVQLLPLFTGRLEMGDIGLDGLSATIKPAEEQDVLDTSKFSDAQLDAFYEKRRQVLAQAGEAAGAESALAVPLALNVQSLKITDSRLELLDAEGGAPTIVELTRLEATGLNLDGRAIPLEVELRLPGEAPLDLELDGRIRVEQESQKAIIDELDLVVKGATASPLQLQASGEMDMSRQIADLQLALELGETRGQGTLRFASFESPQIDTQLKLNSFNPALLALAGPEAAAEAGASEEDAASGDEPLPLDAIRAIDTRARLTIDKAVFGVHAMQNVQLVLRAVDGVVRIQPLTGDLHGGKLDGSAVFNGKHNTARLDTSGKLAGLDLATALAAMESKPLVSGKANLNWKLQSSGRTVNELVAALNGPIDLLTDTVVLEGMGVEKMFCQAVALVNQQAVSAQFPSSSSFQALSARINITDGKAQLNPLRAELPQIKLNGTGNLDLLSQEFKAGFKANLSPELGELDPACKVDERLTAISWPVACKGSISGDPAGWCSIDTGEIIAELATKEVKRKVEKQAGKLLDKLFK